MIFKLFILVLDIIIQLHHSPISPMKPSHESLLALFLIHYYINNYYYMYVHIPKYIKYNVLSLYNVTLCMFSELTI